MINNIYIFLRVTERGMINNIYFLRVTERDMINNIYFFFMQNKRYSFEILTKL
jgi:hypothetical protein